MFKNILRWVVGFTSILALSLALWGQVPDTPIHRVTDTTGTLTESQKQGLETKLEALEKKQGTQILVYVTQTLGGIPIEDYGIQAARKWKPGQAKDNNGAIFFVFKNDRKMRIEVGRGLEGALTDTVTKRLQDELARPRFKTGDYAGGIVAVTDQMIKIASGEPFAPPSGESNWIFWVAILIAVLVVLILIFVYIPFHGGLGGYGFFDSGGGSGSGSSFSSGGGSFDGGGSSSDW